MMIYKRFATEYLVVGRYREKDGAIDLTVQLNVTELNKIPRNLFWQHCKQWYWTQSETHLDMFTVLQSLLTD